MTLVLDASPQPTEILTIAAVCFTRAAAGGGAELLTVRKQRTSRFMLPGGKLDPGEQAEEAAVREVAEELGLTIEAGALRSLGVFDEEAANEADTRIDATIYRAPLNGTPRAAQEIAELRWTPIENPPDDLAPLLARHVLPALRNSAAHAG